MILFPRRLPALVLLLAACLPAARAIPFNSAVTATVVTDDNLTRATTAADRRGDTGLTLALGGDQPHALDRDWLFSWGGGLTAEAWDQYSDLDWAGLSARASLRRRFGLGALAPSLTACVVGGPLLVQTSQLGGWQGTATLAFNHRPVELLRYTLFAQLDRYDANSAFFSRDGHTFGAEAEASLGEYWSLVLGARQRDGGVIAYAQPGWGTTAYGALPEAPTTVFHDPFYAYQLHHARTQAVSLAVVFGLAPRTTLSLGVDFSETSWRGLRYRNQLFSAGLTQQF